MRLFDLRKSLKEEFSQLGIDTVDVDFIVANVLNVSVTELILIDNLDEKDVDTILEKIALRKQKIPVDRIFNKRYFYGLEFDIDDNVLSPRQDSELIVDAALKYIKEYNFKTALDMCTGSGCLAISIKKNAEIDITAVDISSKALMMAKANAEKHGVRINFICSNMFEKIKQKYDLIVCNPPYISTDELKKLDREVIDHDPRLALDGGDMGLKFYNIIHDDLPRVLNDNGLLILEIGEDQRMLVTTLFNDFELIEHVTDYGGNDRVLIFRNRSFYDREIKSD